MGPSRTQKHTSTDGAGEASSSKTYAKQYPQKKHDHKPKRPNNENASTGNALPGVQKIKAALRQTRRLLAKEKLAADVRVATERKQRALEADLVKAETARKEKALAQRYHKIKFFERQKTVRRLKQVKKRLEECTDKKEQKKLEKELFNVRIDLNYIMHYPKLKKYISLYPPEVRKEDSKGKSKSEDGEDGDNGDAPTAETDRQRAELREQIRERMQNGELSMEPETESGDRPKSSLDSHTRVEGGKKAAAQAVPDIEADAFFGEDSDDEEAERMDED